MALVYIGLGSNLDNPCEQLIQAMQMLNECNTITIETVSSLYGSKPMGPQDQPDYVNAVLCLSTALSPLALLDQLQTIELTAGRIRKSERWGARVLDLDILLYDQKIIENNRLTVPHYGMKEREFVLLPLAEIASELLLPCGESVAKLAKKININGLTVLQKSPLNELAVTQ